MDGVVRAGTNETELCATTHAYALSEGINRNKDGGRDRKQEAGKGGDSLN